MLALPAFIRRGSGLWLPRGGLHFANPLGRFGVCTTCCGGCRPAGCSGTITADGTVSYFTHTVNGDGTITRNNLSADCVTYYVDSASGGGSETGSGTSADPWTNLNTVFSDACILSICNTSGCPMVKVKVKGTIDYAVSGNSSRNYQSKLVLEPWSPDAFELTYTSGYCLYYITGCIFKEMALSCTCTSMLSCSFDACTATITACLDAFRNSQYCAFDSCSVTINRSYATSSTVAAVAWNDCTDSTWNDCDFDVTLTTTSSPVSTSIAYGLENCDNGTFDGCTGTVTATGTSSIVVAEATGAYSCSGSSFVNCDFETFANGKQAHAYAYGFDYCIGGSFDNTTGTGTATDTGNSSSYLQQAIGFYQCTSAAFDSCTGEGYMGAGSGASNCQRACGFRSNTSASFSGCSTSSRICTSACDAVWGVCTAWTCDI